MFIPLCVIAVYLMLLVSIFLLVTHATRGKERFRVAPVGQSGESLRCQRIDSPTTFPTPVLNRSRYVEDGFNWIGAGMEVV